MRLTTHLDLNLRLRMSGAIPLLTLCAFPACNRYNCIPVGDTVSVEVCRTFLCVLCQFHGTS
jgi:hypothetical protein